MLFRTTLVSVLTVCVCCKVLKGISSVELEISNNAQIAEGNQTQDNVDDQSHQTHLRFVTYSIGSSGELAGGVQKHGIKTRRDGIEGCQYDIAGAKLYAEKYNRWLGFIDGKGAGSVSKEVAVDKIRKALDLATTWRSSLVLYYTGHGEEGTGNWCFKDGATLSLSELSSLIAEARVRTFIISDCPFSGLWAASARSLRTEHIAILAAGSAAAADRAFSRAFWRGDAFSRALAADPSLAVAGQPAQPASPHDLTKCWFVNLDRHGVSFWSTPPQWRPGGPADGTALSRGEAAAAGAGLAFCVVAWDLTALAGNPLAMPGVVDNAVCAGAVGWLGWLWRLVRRPDEPDSLPKL
jgi:hypothetical protein